MFTYKNNAILIDGKQLREFDHLIKDIISLGENCIVLIKESSRRNLFCIDITGKVKWQVEAREENPEFFPFIRMKLIGDFIELYDGSFTTVADIETGKIKKMSFTK